MATKDCAGWMSVCAIDDIVPDTGVCALVDGEQVAVFHMASGELYAIDNVDPSTGAAVLSRGLVGDLGGHVVVASPIHKQHFDLCTGECLESPALAVHAWQVRREGDTVQVRRGDA
ncbi:nitrite reductase small subunit NirD [Dyella telluris]|uniref:Nitrite reductase small subunit NirD n=1 Tax=Dyella telluris TaxID=2763498 RepID=A0A7G8Q6C8_9GAMM|nr:nitrite reductase small subunit NirD [Dyella telluris]QNK02336.1 nitrite reductase small subunit NirD [Dyella telluris]